jgi:hypothetical protein
VPPSVRMPSSTTPTPGVRMFTSSTTSTTEGSDETRNAPQGSTMSWGVSTKTRSWPAVAAKVRTTRILRSRQPCSLRSLPSGRSRPRTRLAGTQVATTTGSRSAGADGRSTPVASTQSRGPHTIVLAQSPAAADFRVPGQRTCRHNLPASPRSAPPFLDGRAPWVRQVMVGGRGRHEKIEPMSR